jgi:hypothetical protein
MESDAMDANNNQVQATRTRSGSDSGLVVKKSRSECSVISSEITESRARFGDAVTQRAT